MSTVLPGAHLATHTDPICPKLTAGSVWGPGHFCPRDAVVWQTHHHLYLTAGDRSRVVLPYWTLTLSELDEEGERDLPRVVDQVLHAAVYCNVRAFEFGSLECGASLLVGLILVYPNVRVVR